MSDDLNFKFNFDLTLKYLISPRTDKPSSSRFSACTISYCNSALCIMDVIPLVQVLLCWTLLLMVIGLTIPWERGKESTSTRANSSVFNYFCSFYPNIFKISVIFENDLKALANKSASNLNLNLNLPSIYIVIEYYYMQNINTSSNQINNLFQELQQDNQLDNNVNVPQNPPNQQQPQLLSNDQIANALNNLNQAVSNVTFNRQIPAASNQNRLDNLPGEMDNQILLSVQQTFWSNQIKDQKFYCKRCGGLKHTDATNCPKRCNKCFGSHASKDCPNKLLCRWCGISNNPHNCNFMNAINKMAITCPLCKIRGHPASQCNATNMGLSKLIRSLNSFRYRKRNLNKNKGKFRKFRRIKQKK